VKHTLFVAVAALALAARPSADDAKKELDKFQGTWMFVSIEANGMPVPEEAFKDIRLTYKDGSYTFKQGEDVREGTVKIDPTKKPKAIDRTAKNGPNAGKTFKGIYEFDGETLKCCWAVPGGERPKEFVSRAEPSTIIEVTKKAK
jgi:uncharacterized protein (TIGR03067 family)